MELADIVLEITFLVSMTSTPCAVRNTKGQLDMLGIGLGSAPEHQPRAGVQM